MTPLTRAEEEPYVAYAYSYPHKSAYGPLDPPVPLRPLWEKERRDALFLYMHIPFCEMRCGFCNLFTQANAGEDVIAGYLAALSRQANVVADVVGSSAFSRFAIGGGTPTVLDAADLDLVFELARGRFGIHPEAVPTSIETSPQTATPERLAVLRRHGVSRVSIGVQSFLEREAHAIGRPQQTREVHNALERLQEFPVLNLDLIYGQPHQTIATWEQSLDAALRYEPEEIFLYPLYIRPGTGSGKHGLNRGLSEEMRLMYRVGRDRLLAVGYEQVSMRCYRLASLPADGPAYCCQRDGMVGLGCGARSYTSQVHYAAPFAVEAGAVRGIIRDWIRSTDDDFALARWGIHLSSDERRRRFVIQSLLHSEGLHRDNYEKHFQRGLDQDFPQLDEWRNCNWVYDDCGVIRLTAEGLEFSDYIGPALYAREHFQALQEFAG